jgi:DNA polymerase-3 subunit delta
LKKIPSVFLLVGPEEGEKEEFIRGIQREDGEIHRFYAGQTPMADVVSLLRNGSLFSSSKFVTVRNVEELKKPDIQQITDYLKNPEASSTLFLVTHEYRAPAALAKAIPGAQQKTFFELFENKKREWLLRYFREADLLIDSEAVELVLDLVENNTLEMKNAADKLILYFGPGSSLTADDIEEFIYHSKEENVFSLFQKLIRRDLTGSLEILHKILQSGQTRGVQILGGLLWQFRRLLKMSRLCDRRFSPEDALNGAEIRGKRNQSDYLEARRNFTTRQVEQIIARIAESDRKVREQSGDMERLILEMSIYRMIEGDTYQAYQSSQA